LGKRLLDGTGRWLVGGNLEQIKLKILRNGLFAFEVNIKILPSSDYIW